MATQFLDKAGCTYLVEKIKTLINEGGGSGGDADTVDGKHAADFILKTSESSLNVANAATVGGYLPTDFVLKGQVSDGVLGGNADTLDGYHSYEFIAKTDESKLKVAEAAKAGDADTLDGHHASDFVLASSGSVNDATSLQGHPASDFILASNEANLRVAYATDADKLDGYNSSDFVLKIDLPGYDIESGSLSNADTVDGKHADDFILKTAESTLRVAFATDSTNAVNAVNADTVDNKHAADFCLQDLSNRPSNMHLIIDSYNDGNGNWYVEYSNGFVMQGWTGTGTAFHTFLVPYKNAVSFQVSLNWYYNSKTAIAGTIQNRNSRDAENTARVQYGRSDGTGVMVQIPTQNYSTGYVCIACGWKN